MNNLLLSSVIGALSGIAGTGIGGAVAFLLNNPGKRLLSTLISFSAGLMAAVVCFDLLPNAFIIGNLFYGLIGVVAGVFAIILCQSLISKMMPSNASRKTGAVDNSNKNRYPPDPFIKRNYLKTGILLGIGIALHNFPEGLAIGSGFTAFTSYGLGLSLVIAIHDIPEGMAMATPMRMGGMRKLSVFGASLLAGVPTGIGALIGYLLGAISPVFISICLGFAGGAMLYIICGELIPEYRDLHKGRISSIGFVAGVIVGIIISSVI